MQSEPASLDDVSQTYKRRVWRANPCAAPGRPGARTTRVLEHESSENYLTATLTKFWQATSSATRSQPAFETLADTLAYLRRCLNSVVLDAARQIRTRPQEVSEDFIIS